MLPIDDVIPTAGCASTLITQLCNLLLEYEYISMLLVMEWPRGLDT